VSAATAAVLDKLDGVRRSGSGHAARCPAHDDRHASLSVGEGEGGRVLLKCHAGTPCPPELPADVAALEAAIREVGAVLVVVDPLNLYRHLTALHTPKLGGWARPKLERAIAGTASLEDRHLLDQVGHVLAPREPVR